MAETGTALSVVEAQQNIVGGTLVGAAGAGVLAETPGDSTSQILEQIREIQVQTLRAVRSVADGIMEMVAFDKEEATKESFLNKEGFKVHSSIESVPFNP